MTTVIVWILIGVYAVMFIAEFIMVCPDKLPWRKKK